VPKTEKDFESLCENARNKEANFSEAYSTKELSVDLNDFEQTNFHTNPDNFDEDKEVQIRLLSNWDFPYDFKTKRRLQNASVETQDPNQYGSSGYACFSCIGSRRPDPVTSVPEVHEIIIHIHGGGFVGMSSNAHQNVTRRWASRTNIPIFSIDYGCAPQHPYPRGLEDCWQAYRWIVQYGYTYLGINPNKIILAGDSAGGNFCCGITILAIQNNFRVPDCLILAYPALDLSIKRFYPSYMNGVNDFMLNLIMMKIFKDAYVTDDIDPENDPLLSPIVCSDEVLSRFPKVKILAGELDPLKDQSLKFVSR